MVKKIRKTTAAALSAVIALNAAVASAFTFGANAEAQKYEFEDASIEGDITVESGLGASGGSYLKMTESGVITAKFTAPSTDVYNIIIYAGGMGSAKQQGLSVNGISQGALAVPESDSFEKIVVNSIKLKEGENTLSIEKSWGWSNFDYFMVEKATLPDIVATDTTCVDANAIPAAQNLMNYMASVYGSHIISGQQEIYKYGPHDLEQEFEYLNETTGHYPAIRGFDYGNFCCPAFGSDDGSTERVIDWVKNRGGIATSSFHLNVPTAIENYTDGSRIDFSQTTYSQNTTFSPSKAIKEGTKEYKYYTAALDTLAAEFNKLQDENIPVIWRPLHEAEGGGGETGSWFWWGREGSKAYKDLWKFTYDYLVNVKGCHNLIWEWNSYNFSTSTDWYPGDEYVDIIGYDKYSCVDWSTGSKKVYHNDSPIASTFYSLMDKYNSKKMISMAENDSFSTVDNLTSEKAGWLYFCTWYDGNGSAESDSPKFLTDPIFNTKEDTIEMYQSDYCITLDELPSDLYTNGEPITTKPTGTTATKPATTTTTEAVPTDKVSATIKEGKDGYKISFDDAMGDAVYLNLTADKAVSFANGCVGISASVGGTDYWVSYQWTISKSGEVKVDLSKPFNASLNNGKDEVTDKELLAEIAAEAKKQDNGLVQVWWVNDASGEQLDNSNVVLESAYILKKAAEGTTTTTTTADSTTTTTTTVSLIPEFTTTTTTEKYITMRGTGVDSLENVKSYPTKTIYQCGDEFDLSGLELDVVHSYTVMYSDGTSERINNRFTRKIAGIENPELIKITSESGKSYSVSDFTGLAEGTYKVVIGDADGSAVVPFIDEGKEHPTDVYDCNITYDIVIAKDPSIVTTTSTTTTSTTTTTTTTKTVPSGDVIYGDVNLDGSVGMIDLVYLNKYFAKAVTLNEQQLANGDCCADGKVDSSDATALLKYAVKKLESLPVTTA